jgi:hypothetical protein
MVWRSVMSATFVVRIASGASCFALLNPTNGAFSGSQRMTMFVLGWNSRTTSSFFSVEMLVSRSSCGDAPSAHLLQLLRTVLVLQSLIVLASCCEGECVVQQERERMRGKGGESTEIRRTRENIGRDRTDSCSAGGRRERGKAH